MGANHVCNGVATCADFPAHIRQLAHEAETVGAQTWRCPICPNYTRPYRGAIDHLLAAHSALSEEQQWALFAGRFSTWPGKIVFHGQLSDVAVEGYGGGVNCVTSPKRLAAHSG